MAEADADEQELKVREGNPAFSRLLDVLRSGYVQNGLQRNTAERLQQAELRLRSVKLQYLECDALYSTVAGYVGTHGPRGSLEAAEVQHCLELCPGQTVLGTEGRRMRSRSGVGGRGAAREAVEAELKSRCLQMVQWHGDSGGDTSTGSESLRLAKAVQLPQLLTQQVAELKKAEEQLHSRSIITRTLHTQWKALCEVCVDLSTVLERYKLRLRADDDAVTLSLLQSQCQAMLGKQKVLQYQLLKGICSEGRLQALQQVRLHVDSARHDIEEKRMQTERSLEHYRSFGEEFVALAAQYQELLAEIENKQWALSELGKSLS